MWLCLCRMPPFEWFTYQHFPATCLPRLSLWTIIWAYHFWNLMIGNPQSLPRHRFNSIVNDSIRLAKPVWSQSISVCQCYHSSQDGQSQHILLSHLPDVTPQYAMHLMAFLWSTAETIPQTHLCQDVFTLSHCWFILMRRSPPFHTNRKKIDFTLKA